jgi:tetratricopeptide (TPR) repeat protein
MAPLALLLSLLAAAPQCSAGKTQVRGITATLEAGEKLAQKGRYADAERAFAMVLQHKPDNVRGLLNLGTLLPELGRQAEGLSALERLVTIAPGNPSGLFSLGRLQAMTERHASAVVSLRRASALLDVASSPAPDLSVSVLQGLGASLLHLGRYTEALNASDSFNAVLPLPPRALSNRASALLHLGRGDEALEGWAAAIAADRKDLSLLVLRAAALRQLGRGKEACEDLLIVLRELLEPNVAAAAGQPAANAAAALGSTLADLFDDAVYSLQEWQASDQAARAADALPLWRETLELLQTAAASPVRGPIPRETADSHSAIDDSTLRRLWNPAWARNETALAQIRTALAAGRVVQIHNAVDADVAHALRSELLAAAAVNSSGHSETPPPIRRRHEADREEAQVDTERPVWKELDESAQRSLYAPVWEGSGAGGVCSKARTAHMNKFRMTVHSTSPDDTAIENGAKNATF